MDQAESLIATIEGKVRPVSEDNSLTSSDDGGDIETSTLICDTSQKTHQVTSVKRKILNPVSLFQKSKCKKTEDYYHELPDKEVTQEMGISHLLAENERLQRRLEEMDKELKILRQSQCEDKQECDVNLIDSDTQVPGVISEEILNSSEKESSMSGMLINRNNINTKEQGPEQGLKYRALSSSKGKKVADVQTPKKRTVASTKSKNSDEFSSDTESTGDDDEAEHLFDEEMGNSINVAEEVFTTHPIHREEGTDSLPNREICDGEESFKASLIDRSSWLVGLLILQSLSGFILQNNEKLLQQHTVIVNFLTMLVGAGGNAGNQASVRVIRGLAVGTLNSETQACFLWNEAKMALCLSSILGVAGFIRAAVFLTPRAETIAITSSLVAIVSISITIGSLMPLGMNKVRIDPAHSSTTIQVVMDVLGVSITLAVCTLLLNTQLDSTENTYGESEDI